MIVLFNCLARPLDSECSSDTLLPIWHFLRCEQYFRSIAVLAFDSFGLAMHSPDFELPPPGHDATDFKKIGHCPE